MAVLSLILAINFISMRCDSELQIYIQIDVKPHSPHYYYMSLLHLSLLTLPHPTRLPSSPFCRLSPGGSELKRGLIAVSDSTILDRPEISKVTRKAGAYFQRILLTLVGAY